MNERSLIYPLGLDGSATVVATQTKYLVVGRACYLADLVSLANGAITFTNETGAITVSWSATIGGVYVNLAALAAVNANTWVNGTPRSHSASIVSPAVRVPANSIIRTVFTVAGASPSFALFYIGLGLQFI